MNSERHLIIVTTLSMILTFFLHCSLKDTRANDSLIQNKLIDPTRGIFLRACCVWNHGIFNEMCQYFDNDISSVYSLLPIIILELALTFFFKLKQSTYSIRPIIFTIIISLLLARFCDALNLCCQMDIFTVYFLIWQILFLITEWESEKLSLISMNFYRGWLCLMTTSMTFFLYDFIFGYFPIQWNFIFVWTAALNDIIYCLHPEGHFRNKQTLEELSGKNKPSFNGLYYTWNFDDDDELEKKSDRACLGIGDISMFSFMLLMILPPLSSIETKVCITIGHIIAVQIGQQATARLGRLYNQLVQPALPLPVIFVSIYAFLLNTFMEY